MIAKMPLGLPSCRCTTLSCPPKTLNDCRCECVCTKHEKGEMCQNACQGTLVWGFIEGINSGGVGEGNKIIKKHIEK